MKKLFLFLSINLSLLSFATENLVLQSIVKFDGTSTLHDFTGMATSKVSKVLWTPTQEGGQLSASGITFDVEKFTTDHTKRDQNMMKMFNPVKFPVILGSFKDWDLGGKSSEKEILRVTIQGNEIEVPVTISDYRVDEKGIHFTSHFTLSLQSFGLKRPAALVFIRVGDEINVTVHTHLSNSK